MQTFRLALHAAYACGHSGACCRSGWAIPVERSRHAALAARAASLGGARVEWLTPAPIGAPEDVAGVLAQGDDGACVFHAPGTGCLVHAARPASCEHFPYVVVIDPRGVHVSLSHYCPTAASLLFHPEASLAIVAGAPIVPDGRLPEGLDARDALPPVAGGSGPARLMDWADVTAWEQAAVYRWAESARAVPLSPHEGILADAYAAVPAGLPAWQVPPSLKEGWTRWGAAGWGDWHLVIGRYLGARVMASWALHLGEGVSLVDASVAQARCVLQAEVVRACIAGDGPLTRDRLTQAIRQADLLLLHHADPRALAEAAADTL